MLITNLGPKDSAAAAEEGQAAFKAEHYLNPERYGETLNAEGRSWREAVAQGLVAPDAEGIKAYLNALSRGTVALIQLGPAWYPFVAFSTRMVSNLTANQAAGVLSAVQFYGGDVDAMKAALEAQFSQPIAVPPPPPSSIQPSPTTVAAAVPGLQIVVTREAPPSPGDGINFATVAWRKVDVVEGKGWTATGNWQKWTGAFVKRNNDPRVQILFVDDVLYEGRNFQGVPGRIAPMWDVGGLESAIAGAGNGLAPPSLAQTVTVNPTEVRPTIPSGSIPIPDDPEPVRGWTDATVPGGTTDLTLPSNGGRGPLVTPGGVQTLPTLNPAPTAGSGGSGAPAAPGAEIPATVGGVPTWMIALGAVAGALALFSALKKGGS